MKSEAEKQIIIQRCQLVLDHPFFGALAQRLKLVERLDIPIREQPGQWPHVTIGQDSWIGDRAIIQCDVGKHCVIGSGSVVTTPIPDYAIAVGVPAKVVRFRNQQETSNGEAAQARS